MTQGRADIDKPARGHRGREPSSGTAWARAAHALPGPVALLIILSAAIEAILTASDWGLVGSPYWRGAAYLVGAFWGQILGDGAAAVFPGQRATMFLSYALLHGGLLHCLVNMAALASFGPIVARRAGSGGFLKVYLISTLAGAALFGALSAAPAPMVGASGALFGLLGAWLCWEWLDRRALGRSIAPVLRILGYLVLYNVVVWVILDGRLAWEAHLGGFLAGWGYARMRGRPLRRRHERR